MIHMSCAVSGSPEAHETRRTRGRVRRPSYSETYKLADPFVRQADRWETNSRADACPARQETGSFRSCRDTLDLLQVVEHQFDGKRSRLNHHSGSSVDARYQNLGLLPMSSSAITHSGWISIIGYEFSGRSGIVGRWHSDCDATSECSRNRSNFATRTATGRWRS